MSFIAKLFFPKMPAMPQITLPEVKDVPNYEDEARQKEAEADERRRALARKGRKSTIGAHTNLNEYPNAAQLKNVTAERSNPASRSHRPKDENISSSGSPAEKPKNSMVITRGCIKD